MRLWDVEATKVIRTSRGADEQFFCVAFSPDGQVVADADIKQLRVSNVRTGKTFFTHRSTDIISMAWSPTASVLACGVGYPPGQSDAEVHFFGVTAERVIDIDSVQVGDNSIYGIAWQPNGRKLALAGGDTGTIFILDGQALRQERLLEGHTSGLDLITFSSNGQLLASRSHDKTIRIWRCDTWDTVAVLEEQVSNTWMHTIAFHPTLPLLATLGEEDTVIRIWKLNYTTLLGKRNVPKSVHYTTAKLVLVGDTGVGKTGLGWRLAHGAFKEHTSTHGQQFWVLDDLYRKRKDGTDCEAVLWDLAGQHVYRPVHAIFLDDVDLSLIVFDPTNRQDPLKGVSFWLEQLAGKKQLPPSVLVGARVDRGRSALSRDELLQFCQQHGISGGYIGTSAVTGEGVDELLKLMQTYIPWDQKKATVTTATFKRIKEYVLALKEKPDRRGVLVPPGALRQQLQAIDPDWQFTDAEMMSAVKHLENHGYVAILRRTSHEESILLTPELLMNVASSIFLEADRHPRELGAISETGLLEGRYSFPELIGLEVTEQRILLEAAVIRFLERAICFRETLGPETLLVFPNLIKQKRPLLDDIETIEDMSYIVRGRVENVYAAMVVLLGYTQAFTRVNQWQNQAQYEMGRGEICGFRLIEEREGEIEMVLYYSDTMPAYGRTMFQGLFENFLYQHDVEVTQFPPVMCPKGHRQERIIVIKGLREHKKFSFCSECGKKVTLPDLDEPVAVNGQDFDSIRREEALARLRSKYETYLANVKNFRHDRAAPRCYLSFLPAQADWAKHLKRDLSDAGAFIIENSAEIKAEDVLVLLCSPAYKQAWEHPSGTLIADATLIRSHLKQSAPRCNVILLLGGGGLDVSSPDELRKCPAHDFREETRYAISLFDLVLDIYAVPPRHLRFAPLRQSLQEQWERLLGGAFQAQGTAPDENAKAETATKEITFMNYQDFQLLITNEHRIRASSEQGDEWSDLQLDNNTLELALQLIEKGATDSELLKGVGGELYRALFPNKINGQFRATLAAAAGAGNAVRLRLLFQSPDLAALPWEFLYDESTNSFLANNTNTALSRYIDVPLGKRDLKAASRPLKILLVISSPSNLDKLDAAEEERLIREALSKHIDAGEIELDVLTEATIRNIHQHLRAKPYNVFHFIGHGVFRNDKGHIALVEPDGRAKLMDDENFANFFLGNNTLGLAVLNACQGATVSSNRAFAGIAPNLVRRGIPAVVAMQYSILDTTACLFADEFYRTLALGWPVDAAIQTTRNTISMEVGLDKPDFGTPVLFMRAKDGLIMRGL